VVLNTVKI